MSEYNIERLAHSIVNEMERIGGGQVYKISVARDAAVKMLAKSEARVKELEAAPEISEAMVGILVRELYAIGFRTTYQKARAALTAALEARKKGE